DYAKARRALGNIWFSVPRAVLPDTLVQLEDESAGILLRGFLVQEGVHAFCKISFCIALGSRDLRSYVAIASSSAVRQAAVRCQHHQQVHQFSRSPAVHDGSCAARRPCEGKCRTAPEGAD